MPKNKEKTCKPVGLLNLAHSKNNFDLVRFHPKANLQNYIEHYWFLSWNLPQGQTHRQEVIPHPCTHLTFADKESHIQGICREIFSHTLEGSGNIIGIKFKPAGFYSFANKAGRELIDLTNTVIDIDTIFDVNTGQAEQAILSLNKPEDKIDYLDHLLFNSELKEDPTVIKLNHIVADIAVDKSIMKVSDICIKFGIEQRSLQRLFIKYIGISAKWVINRYRMHDALTSIESTDAIDWAELATKLGYYDQSHFIKAFKSLTGKTPKDHHGDISRPSS